MNQPPFDLRALALLMLCLAAPGCGPADADAQTDGGGGGAEGSGGAPAPAPDDPDLPSTDAFEVRFAGHHGDYDVAADGTVPYVWGWQGGTMIQPRVDFPDDAGFAEGDTVRVRFRVDPEPEWASDILPDTRETVLDMTLYRGAGPLNTGSVELQLGWEALDGVRLRLRVDVEGVATTFDRTVELVLEEPQEEHACADLADGLDRPGCVYADVPGELRTEMLAPLEADADPCAVVDYTARGVFTPSTSTLECIAAAGIEPLLERTYDVTFLAKSACLEGHDVTPGGHLPVVASLQLQGTCSPIPTFAVPGLTEACGCD